MIREDIAGIADKVMLMPPLSGPPFPQGLTIRWPREVTHKMPGPVHQVDKVYMNIRNTISRTIRGY